MPTHADLFGQRYGFARSDVTLRNWRTPPFSRWSFQNTREIGPSATMNFAGSVRTPQTPLLDGPLGETVTLDGRVVPFADFLVETETDLLLVLKDGRPVVAWQAPYADLALPHMLFSVSKSLTGLVIGALSSAGILDLSTPVGHIVREAEGSAYTDATVRDLLDMRVSLAFEETYGETGGWGGRYCRAVLWNPDDGRPYESHLSVVMSIRKGAGEHGGPVHYRSPNTDVLGIVAERASGKRFADLLRDHLWEPLGAENEAYVTLDREGTAQAAGGMVVSARDLARVGEMMRNGGRHGGREVIAESFVIDTLGGGDGDAYRAGDFAPMLPDGRYRNQWHVTGFASGAFYGVGVHGQWLYVNPLRKTTIVKFASQGVPHSDGMNRDNLLFLEALSDRV